MTLNDYIVEKGMTAEDFHHLVGLSYSQIQKIKNNPSPILSIDSMVKIYNATKEKFGEGLKPKDYIENFPDFLL